MHNQVLVSRVVTICMAVSSLWLSCLASGQEKPSELLITPTENLVVEGVPPIPASLADRVRRYTESRGAAFYSWHPVKREMLIGTRFANSVQVHNVKAPGAARTQLTFFSEPVAAASFEPNSGDYFLFSRDAGGTNSPSYIATIPKTVKFRCLRMVVAPKMAVWCGIMQKIRLSLHRLNAMEQIETFGF